MEGIIQMIFKRSTSAASSKLQTRALKGEVRLNLDHRKEFSHLRELRRGYKSNKRLGGVTIDKTHKMISMLNHLSGGEE